MNSLKCIKKYPKIIINILQILFSVVLSFLVLMLNISVFLDPIISYLLLLVLNSSFDIIEVISKTPSIVVKIICS